MTIPYPGLEPAETIEAPDIIQDVSNCLGRYADFVLFSAFQVGIPRSGQVAHLVYAVRNDLLVFTQMCWCRHPEGGLDHRLRRTLMRASTDAVKSRIDENAFNVGDVYVDQADAA